MADTAALTQTMYDNLATGIEGFPDTIINIGSIEGASDINAGWTLFSGYLVRGPEMFE